VLALFVTSLDMNALGGGLLKGMIFSRVLRGCLALSCFALLVSSVQAQNYSFQSSDASLGEAWTFSYPDINFSSSASSYNWIQGNGLELNSRAWLHLATPLEPTNTNITVSGSFTNLGPEDFVKFVFQTSINVSAANGFGEVSDGLEVVIGRPNGSGVTLFGASFSSQSPFAAFDFEDGGVYDFVITDMGNSVSVWINNLLIIEEAYTDSSGLGSNFLVYNREDQFGFTLSSLSISAVPEPSAFAAFAGLGALLFSVFRRRIRR
jgi:hypothetical protein